jgi:hypothetical protein
MPNMLSPYAPVRYRGLPWWEYSRGLARDNWVTPEGKVRLHIQEKIWSEFTEPEVRASSRALAAEGHYDALGEMLATLYGMHHFIVLVAQFEGCGREIFELPEQLVEMFRNTDVDECTLEDWHAPHHAFFLRFGKQADVRLPYVDERTEFEYLDGAFVAVTPMEFPENSFRLKIGLTTVREDGSGLQSPGYFLDFFPDTHPLPRDKAIQRALERRYAELDKEPATDENIRAITMLQKQRYSDAASLISEASRLIFNALYYIESRQRDSVPVPYTPGHDVPATLQEKWNTAKPEKRRKLKSKLMSEDFAVVRFLGKELVLSEPSTHGDGTVRPHWRKGFWRQQPYGEGFKLRKRRWIHPTRVNLDRVDVDLPGRIYVTAKIDGLRDQKPGDS